MATFIVTYDTHLRRNYTDLYTGMDEHGGVRLAESVWGIVLNNTPAEVRDWVMGLLDADDTIVVVQIKPEPSWASWNAKKKANDWLRSHA